VHDLASDYEKIRNTTTGRSDQGKLGEFLSEGKRIGFSSARKMMSWITTEEKDYRLFSKGAAEVIFSRCSSFVSGDGYSKEIGPTEREDITGIASDYARRGMRCLALAYRDVPAGFDLDGTSESIKNADGSQALKVEKYMILICLFGIEDPLRAEAPGMVEKCYIRPESTYVWSQVTAPTLPCQ